MDQNWTPRLPAYLYRIQTSTSNTIYQPGPIGGLFSSATTPYNSPLNQNTYTINSPSAFLASIFDHLTITPNPSPYISFFKDKSEAEVWAIAAEDVTGREAKLMIVDVMVLARHRRDDEKWKFPSEGVWNVRDLKRGLGVGDGWGNNGCASEFLVLWFAPHVAIIGAESSRDIRKRRGAEPFNGRFQLRLNPTVEREKNVRRGREYHSLWLGIGEQDGVALPCGCRSAERCVCIEWPRDEEIVEIDGSPGAAVAGWDVTKEAATSREGDKGLEQTGHKSSSGEGIHKEYDEMFGDCSG